MSDDGPELLESVEALLDEAKHIAFTMPGWTLNIRPGPLYSDPTFEVVLTVETYDTYLFREPTTPPERTTTLRVARPPSLDHFWDAGRLGEVSHEELRCEIRIRELERDVLNPRVRIKHTRVHRLPIRRSEFPGIVRRDIHSALQHEADEWIRFGDEMVFDPHKDEG